MKITIPDKVQFIINTFYKNGYEAFMVGGCIRDIMLNKIPSDYDIATSAPPEVTEKLFSKTIPTGIQHGTITVLIEKEPFEVTTYRLESEYINNRKPSKVEFVSDIKEDLSRRDFTINAFAYNDKKGLIDYFQGNTDLNSSIIRCVGVPNKRFNEDALRMLRAIRFSCQLNFDIEEETFKAICQNALLIKNISNERIRSEFSKLLLSENPYKGLLLLKSTKILELIIKSQINIDSSINKLKNDLSIRLASLFFKYELEDVHSTLKTLTFDNTTIKKVLSLLSNYNLVKNCNTKYKCKKLIISTGKDNIFDLINLYEITENTNLDYLKNTIEQILNNEDTLFIKDLNIDGNMLKNHLNLTNGKLIGKTLNHLLDLVLSENIDNNYNDLLLEAKNFCKKEAL